MCCTHLEQTIEDFLSISLNVKDIVCLDGTEYTHSETEPYLTI